MKRYLMIEFSILFLLQWLTRGLAQTSSLSPATSTVQYLVDRASAGDTIRIEPGLYEGNVVIAKSISLIGIGMPVLRGEGKGSCVTIVADSCIVRGFVVEHSGGMLVNEDAGILVKSKHNIIWGNELRDILFGIYLFQADSNLIAHNRIVGRRELELGERGSGIHVWNSHSNRLVGNTISDARDGFYIQNANRTLIMDNDVFDLRYGLHYMYADSNVFLGNKFHDNVAGAAVMYSTGIVMRRNAFVHNRGFASYGILFQDCHWMQADSNIVADNVVGMFFEASTDNLFRHNIIARNDLALQMFQNSINNTFAENNFIDNLSPLTIVGKRTESRWSKDGRGNYWSSYDGYDIDADGIGDVPMKIQNIFTYLEGSYPNLRLYLYSPASQALAVAAKAFPILAINEERDENPLMRPMDLGVLVADEDSRSTSRDSMVARNRTSWWFGVPVVAIGVLGILYVRGLKQGAR
jgi:nitrous oxidase accessory protein